MIDHAIEIENGINRGTRYLDSNGKDFIITYISVKIKNVGKHQIRLSLELQDEYPHPNAGLDENYEIIWLPEEWAKDGADVTKSMLDNLDEVNLSRDKIINPKSTFVFALGTRRKVPAECSPIPNALFVVAKDNEYMSCDDKLDLTDIKLNNLLLGVKLDYCDNRCVVLPAGKIDHL